MMTILRLIVFALSCIGSWEVIRRKAGIHIYFLPSLTIAIQTGILFAAGLLGVLWEAAILLFVFGLVSLIVCIVHDKGLSFLKNYLKTGYLFLLVSFILLYIAVQGRIFAHYDNFSHWALVVQQMLLTNQFPSAQEVLIEFFQYPLGSSAYIYYFSRAIGTAEPIQMFAQSYMMISCIVPLFLFCKKHAWATFLCVLAAANFFLVCNIPITDLLVDTLLPLVFGCSFVYAQQYGKKIQNKAAFFGIAFYLIWLVQIKNAGIVLAAFMIIWLLVRIRKDRHAVSRLIVSLVPLISVVMWNWHVKQVFSDGLMTKHAMSVGYYVKVFGEKTPEEIWSVIKGVLVFSVTWPEVWMVFGFVLLVGILAVIFAREERIPFLKTAAFGVVLYVVFQLGLVWMYLFSMPSPEAAYLAEIERYTRAVLIAVFYLMMVVVIKIVSGQDRTIPAAAVSAGIVLAAFCGISLLCFGEVRTVFRYIDRSSERVWIEKAAEEFEVPDGESYCIFPSYDDGGYSYFIGKYIFGTNEVCEIYVTEEADLEQMPSIPSRYLFVMNTESEILRNWIQENYPDQAGNKVIIRTP